MDIVHDGYHLLLCHFSGSELVGYGETIKGVDNIRLSFMKKFRAAKIVDVRFSLLVVPSLYQLTITSMFAREELLLYGIRDICE